MPGSNVITINQLSARSSFRQELFETFHDVVLDDVDRVRLLTTYGDFTPQAVGEGTECPYANLTIAWLRLLLPAAIRRVQVVNARSSQQMPFEFTSDFATSGRMAKRLA